MSRRSEENIMVYLLLVNYCRKMSTRKCTKCGETKTVEEFAWKYRAKGKRHAACKVCKSAQAKRDYQDNREAVRAQQRQYREANREEINARNRQYREANREEINARQREHYEANREAVLARNREHYEANREAVRAQQRQYREANREEINAWNRQYYQTPEARALANAAANARNATEEGKLLNKIRKLHHKFYKGINLGRVTTQRGEALVGCSRKDYRDHLASMFKDGMTHDNYGHGSDKWQIDHIIPIHAFKGEVEAHLQMIFWWRNTQPLWTPENIAKGDYYTEEGKQDLITRYQAWVTAGKPPPVH